LPSLEKLHQQFKDRNFILIAIDINEKREAVLKSVRRNGLSFTNLLDPDGQVASMYGVNSTPAKFLIDTEGNMVGAALGYRDWEQDEFIALIEELMKQ
jgi:peroxiredoxin